MDNIMIICTVCADFFSPKGDIFRVLPIDRGVIKEAPAWIQETTLFKLLQKDGSISFVNHKNQKKLENDPLEGIGADGKAEKAEETKEPVKVEVEPLIKPKKRTTKKG